MSNIKSFAFAYPRALLDAHSVFLFIVTSCIMCTCTCFSAELDVVISSGPLVDNGTDTTLTCTTTESGTIRQVTWRKGPFNVTFNDADAIVFHNAMVGAVWGPLLDRNHYEFDHTLSGVPLTIKSVTLHDDAQYWCQLNVAGAGNQIGTAVMRVRVPPNAVVVSYNDTTYSTNSAPVSVVAGSDRQFTCKANGVKPEANFTWTYSSNTLQGTSQDSTQNADDARLFDSSNIVSIDITETPAEQPLKCGATNRQGNVTEVEINLKLQVKVPPKASLMSLYDTSMELISPGTPLAVDEGTPYTITCKVQGTRPAVSIQWMVDKTPHQGADTSSSVTNGLIDTVGMMTFTPTRDNHRKIVKCTANTTESQSPYPFVTTDLDVTVFPSIITLSDSTGAYPPGWTSYLVEGQDHGYTCKVPDIRPGASFTWTVDTQYLPHSSSNVTDDTGFTTSTSNASIVASFEQHHNRALKCLAINKEGTTGESVNVTIDVKVPPKESSVSLSYAGSDQVSGGNLTVNQGKEQTLTCMVQGSRPAATITLYRNGAIEETEDQTPGGDGLVDTMENWVFTPQRNYHKQRVKCEAKTKESTMPYPAADLTLVVDGPPDTPVIMGSVTMTENVSTTLTCTADLGYPNDWRLVWFNNGNDIGFQPATREVSSGPSQRHNFTSELEFTPWRRDNTHIITCTASRDSWPPLTGETMGPINVQYETYITNKHQSEVGIRIGQTANLTCIAKGNPAPIITWLDPNNTDIINGGNGNKYTVVVSYTTSDTDMTVGDVTTSKLSIRAVDPQVDYGLYTCNSNNNIGQPDSHTIIVNGTRRPNMPTGVELTGRTSSSIAVRWSAGYDGGETQWFHVSHKKTADSSETFSDRIDEGVTTYNVDGLESYTEYEIKVYAENDVGKYPSPGSILEHTLPESVKEKGIKIEFNKDKGTVKISELKDSGGCIQLEVKYVIEGGSSKWTECGDCIEADDEVVLAERCPQTGTRRRRAVGDVIEVQAKYCEGSDDSKLCSDPITPDAVKAPPGGNNIGIIAGGVVGGLFLIAIIGVLVVYLLRTSPPTHKPPYSDTSSIELAINNSGQVNEGLQSSDDEPLREKFNRTSGYISLPEPVDDEPETPTTTWSVDQATKTVIKAEEKPVKSSVKKWIKGASTNKAGEKPVKYSVRKSAKETTTNKADEKPGKSSVRKSGKEASIKEKPLITKPKPSMKKPGLEGTKPGGAETNAKPVERMVTDSGDTYAIVNKEKPRKPAPQNLPDVTNPDAVYAAVNKAPAKKPKKYVPPSKLEAESDYEDVKLPAQKEKPKIDDEEDDYANLEQCQSASGRTVDQDGLIYMEVGHLKAHPANQPPIQTEESTTYASIDFSQLAPPDVARN